MECWHLITRIIWIQDSFTFTFYVAFIIITFSDLDVGCMFRPALVCWDIVYSDQLLGAHHKLIYLITIHAIAAKPHTFHACLKWKCNLELYGIGAHNSGSKLSVIHSQFWPVCTIIAISFFFILVFNFLNYVIFGITSNFDLGSIGKTHKHIINFNNPRSDENKIGWDKLRTWVIILLIFLFYIIEILVCSPL